MQVLVLLLSILAVARGSLAQTLEAIVITTRLPSKQFGLQAGYDGQDSIYLWGGSMNNELVRDVYKFSISQQTIATIGTAPKTIRLGSGCWIGNNGLVHFGGVNNSNTIPLFNSDVWNFETTNLRNWTLITNLSDTLVDSTSVWDGKENTYIVGGSNGQVNVNTISKYSNKSQTVEIVAQMPTTLASTAAVWDNVSRVVYIFGGIMTGRARSDQILKFNPADGQVIKLSATLPIPNVYGCAVWARKDIYIIGGVRYLDNDAAPIVRFTPTTNQVISLPVVNLSHGLEAHACVYDERSHRIYVFGAWDWRTGDRDEIIYIDLNDNDISTTPPTTNTATHGSSTFYNFSQLCTLLTLSLMLSSSFVL